MKYAVLNYFKNVFVFWKASRDPPGGPDPHFENHYLIQCEVTVPQGELATLVEEPLFEKDETVAN